MMRPCPRTVSYTHLDVYKRQDLPWWKVFKNKDLQDLLTDTYQNNRDLKATMARVEKARQYITITEATLFPWADYSGSLSTGSNYTSGNVVQTCLLYTSLTCTPPLWAKAAFPTKGCRRKGARLDTSETKAAVDLRRVRDCLLYTSRCV